MEGFNKEQKSDSFGVWTPEQRIQAEMQGAIATVEALLRVITVEERERIDYALNQIDETEQSLLLANDQHAVIGILEKIMQQKTFSDAARVATTELNRLL